MNLNKSTDFYEWSPAAWLRVTGGDAAGFLQGQFTNELRQLKATGNEAVYGLWLNQKGKVLADSFILQTAEAFWIGSYGSPATVIKERLEAYIIADDVNIEDVTTEWAGLSVFDDERPNGMAGVFFQGRRSGRKHFEWVFPREKSTEMRRWLGERKSLSEMEMAQMRMSAGIPWVPTDIGPSDLPNEGSLEVDAISYTKGCYLGQEVMARLKAMGQVRRHLVRVRGSGEAVPAELFQNGKKIGELRSVAKMEEGNGFVGLAMITLMHWRKEEGIGFSAEGPLLSKGELL